MNETGLRARTHAQRLTLSLPLPVLPVLPACCYGWLVGQREGDNLDQEIQRCEREIRALQNTLNHLMGRNSNLRTSLAKVRQQQEALGLLALTNPASSCLDR